MYLKTTGLKVPQWIRILILTQLFAATIAQPGCIRCEDFNRIQPKGCAQNYEECGDCLTSFIEDTEDPRLCYALEILTDANDDITQEVNSNVYLICKFNALVSCKWSKDGEEVKDIGPESNRKWTAGKGENTEDCSLTISQLRDEDVGSWECSNMADSNVNQISAHPIQLNIQAKLVQSPEASYTVEEGNLVTLACKFDHRVSCSWTRNNSPVSSSGNYQFAKSEADCSLTIARVSVDEDGVNWKCSAKGDPFRNSVSADSTTLNVAKKEKKAKVTRALYVADQNAKVSPLIYYGSEVVNGATLMYPGDEAMAGLLSVQCQLPGAIPSGHRLWWVLHEDREYQEQSNGPLNVGLELGTAIVQQLKLRDKIELICMAEDGLKQVSTANVFFIAGVSQSEVVAAASSFDTIIIVLFVFIAVIVLALIGAIATLIWALSRKKKVNGNVKVNDVMEANDDVERNDDVEANKPPEGCQRSDSTISTDSASSTTRLLKKT